MNITKTSLIIFILLLIPATIAASEENIMDMIADHDENRDGIVKVMVVDNTNGGIIIEYDVYIDTNEYIRENTLTQTESVNSVRPTEEMVKVPGFTISVVIIGFIGAVYCISRRIFFGGKK